MLNSVNPKSKLPVAALLMLSLIYQAVPLPVMAATSVDRSSARKKSETARTSSKLFLPNPQPQPPVGPVVTATKVDSFPDPNADGKADPGETITYTINISNAGPGDATGVTFTDTIDSNTTLVPLSGVLATDDDYNTIGNVNINVNSAPQGLLANDKDIATGNNTGMTASGGTTSTQGGTVSINADGTFTYDPPVGFTGADTFTYTATTATGKTAVATAHITVTGRIWFINDTAGACTSSCDGRLSHPFQSLAAFQAVNDNAGALTHPKVGDSIFLYENNALAYSGPVTLLNNQKFIGQDATASLITITGLTQPSGADPLPAMNATPATIVNITSGANAINLGQGNLLRGFTVGATTGTKISGNTFGTLTVGNNSLPDVTLNGNGQALNLTTGTFAATSGFVSVATTSSTTSGLTLTSVAGTVAFGSTTVSGNNNECLITNTSTADVNFGNTSCTGGANGVSLSGNTSGTRTFGTLSVSGGSGNAFVHSGGGGNVTVNGAANLSSGAPDTIVIQNAANTNLINFAGGATVNKTGAAGEAVWWSGTNTGATLTFATLALTTSNATGMNLSGGGTVNVTTAAGSSISATGVGAQTAPAILANGVALNANLTTTSCNGSGTGGNCISLTTVTGTSNLGGGTLTGATGATFLVNGGTASVTYTGGITQANNAAMVSISGGHNTGTITFNAGTLSATNGTGLQFDNADGTYNFNGTNTLNGGDAGIDIQNGSGGTFSFSTNTSINNPSGIAYREDTSTPSVTYNGTITKNNNANSAVSINAHTGNTTTFNGGITASTTTANAITLTGNTGGTINFNGSASTGGLSLTTTSGTGFNTTGGGTISATQNNTSIVNTITTTTGTALNVASTTIGGSGLTFRSISSNGAASGIILNTTGAGTFTITGNSASNCKTTPANCDGGAIQSSTGPGMNFTSTGAISMTNVNVASGGDDGIRGSTVGSFTLITSRVVNNGNAVTERGIEMTNLTGTGAITNSTITGNAEDNFWIQNSSGTLSSFNVTGSTFSNTSTSIGNDGIHVEGIGTAHMTISVTGCTFDHNRGDHFQVTTDAVAAGVVMNATFNNNTLTADRGTTYGGTDLGGSITINPGGAADVTYDIESNNIQGAVSSGVSINSSNTSVLHGTLNNNTIGTSGTVDSGSSQGDGFSIFANNSSAIRALVTNNTIHQYSNLAGINVQQRSGSATVQAVITGNTISNGGTFAAEAIFVSSGTVSGDSGTMCLDIGGAGALANSFAGAGANGSSDFRVRQRFNTTVRLPGYGGTNQNTAAVVSFIQGRNTGSPSGQATVPAPFTGGGFVGGAACTAPLLLAQGGIESVLHAPSLLSSFVLFPVNELSFLKSTSERVARAARGSVLTPASPVTASLSQRQVDSIVSAAIDRWAATGLTPQQLSTLRGIKFEIADLQGSYLGEADDNRILVDRNAEGKGWFVDANPLSDSSFARVVSATRRYTDPMNAAAGHIDLLTAIEHEIGHKLGLDDSYLEKDRDSIMYGYLTVGERRIPAPGQAKNAQSGALEGVHFLTLSEAKREVKTNHPTRSRVNPASKPLTPMSGETVSITIGTLHAGESAQITFQVVVNNPYFGGPNVSNQGTVSGSNFTPVLTDDPAVGGASDPTLTPIFIANPNINVNDAKAAEPASGSAPMLFTVALSAPAPGAGVTVHYSTADQAPGPGHAVAGSDYTAVPDTILTFASGEQIKTVSVSILADVIVEPDETFLLNLSNATGGTIVDGQALGTITQNVAGTFLISELRTSGPGGPGDDFVELYNNTTSPLTVASSDATAGYGVFKMGTDCNATPVLIATIPNGTIIPARGHFLLVGSQYSLAAYAAGDLAMTTDIESDRNVAVFSTTNVANLSTTTRLDAVGFDGNTGGGVCDLLREGTTLPAIGVSLLEHSFFRDPCGKGGNPAVFGQCSSGGKPVDLNNNATDFIFADTTATNTIAGQHLGAPGPENLASPIDRTSSINGFLLDATKAGSVAPNRVRDLTNSDPPNTNNGTLSIRRRFVNNTGAPITRLRFRIVDMSSFPVPGDIADLRALTSVLVTVIGVTDLATCQASGFPTQPCNVDVQGTTLEQPPNQAMGGALNSSLITLGTPLASGASINLQFKLGVQTTGTFKFFMNVEALP